MIRETKPLAENAALLLILFGVPLVCAWLAVGSAIGLVGIVFVPEFTYPFLLISPFDSFLPLLFVVVTAALYWKKRIRPLRILFALALCVWLFCGISVLMTWK